MELTNWGILLLAALLISSGCHGNIQRPLGRVNAPLQSAEAIPDEGELPSGEREVVPGEGEIIPGSQLEGENLHHPNPQMAGEHPNEGEEMVIDRPVGNVNNGGQSIETFHEAPQFIRFTDRPHVHVEETTPTTVKPSLPHILLIPTLPTNTSAPRNDSEITTGDISSNTSTEAGGEEVNVPAMAGHHPSISTSAPVPVDAQEIVPTRVAVVENTLERANGSDVDIPEPDSNLKLTSHPVVEETDTVTESVSNIESSMSVVLHTAYANGDLHVHSRIIPDANLETPSLNTISVSQANSVEQSVVVDEVILLSTSTFYSGETDLDLSSKERQLLLKPSQASVLEVTETVTDDLIRSSLSEQTYDVTPSSSNGFAETSSSSATFSSSVSPTSSVAETSSVSMSLVPNEVTLPAGSHEIVIQKNSTLSVLGTTNVAVSTTSVSTPPTATGSTQTSTKVSTVKQETTPSPTTVFVNISSNTTSTATLPALTTTALPNFTRTSTALSLTSTISNYTTLSPTTFPNTTTSTGQGTSSNVSFAGQTTLSTVLTTKRKNKNNHGSTVPSLTTKSSSESINTTESSVNSTESEGRKKTSTAYPQTLSTTSSLRTSKSSSSTAHWPVTYPSSTKPPVFAQVKLKMSWRDFCDRMDNFRTDLQDIFEIEGGHNVTTEQIMLGDIQMSECVDLMGANLPNVIQISFYLVDVLGNYDEYLTVDCAHVVLEGYQRKVQSYFYRRLVEVKLNTDHEVSTPHPVETKPVERESLFAMEPGITIAIVIASVGGTCCVVLIILQIVMRRRNKRLYLQENRHNSYTSMDSIALASVTKSRPNSGLFNPGLENGDAPRFNLDTEPLYPVNFAGLAHRCLDPETVKEEFQVVPNHTPRLSTVPVGAEDKNRYANVIPVPQTRVKLKRRASQATSDYINANYITGFGDDKHAYIATQAPLGCTVSDFWRMVWEQQSRVIVMLTAIEENGHPKCSQYWPDCFGDSMQRYGDFMIHLKKKDVYQEYIVSILELKDIENNLVREVKHCWYTCWPVNGTPEPISLVKFILDTRVFYEDSGAPLIVHCSPGTGRTGTLIATDICMRQYESRRIVDVLNTVYRLRQERAGSVQTKEQYILIYNALNEYASVLRSPCISTASSSMTLHNIP